MVPSVFIVCGGEIVFVMVVVMCAVVSLEGQLVVVVCVVFACYRTAACIIGHAV